MTNANLEDRRAYARAHYQANKDRYNPGRKLALDEARRVRSLINQRVCAIAEKIRLLSDTRWVGPTEIRRMCGIKGKDVQGAVFDSVLWRLASLPYLRDGIAHTGLLQREPVFTEYDAGYGEFKFFAMRKHVPKDCRAELLLLNLTIKRKMTYGR